MLPCSARPALPFLAFLLAVTVAFADETSLKFHGAAGLPAGCGTYGAQPWIGAVSVDGLESDLGILSADVRPEGLPVGSCPPPIYGFVVNLLPTADPATRSAAGELTMQRCQLSSNTSTRNVPFLTGTTLDDRPDLVAGQLIRTERFTTLKLEGRVVLWYYETQSQGELEHECGSEVWYLSAALSSCAPKKPPQGEWDELPALPKAPKVKCRSGGKCKKKGGKSQGSLEAAAARLVPVQPCAEETLCLGKPGSDRADVLVRNVELLDGTQALAYLTLTTSEVEVWRLLEDQSDDEAVSWLLPALGKDKTDASGLLDTWDTSLTDLSLRRTLEAAPAPQEAVGSPKPPAKGWITFDALPGFRFQVRYNAWLGVVKKQNGVGSDLCPAATACFGRSAEEPATAFVRLIAEKNGARSPLLVKFATEPVEVWIEQTAKKRVRYVRLAGTPPFGMTLDGRLDREGFPK